MNNSELDQLLKAARPPEPREGFWEQFPKQVMTRIRHEESQEKAGSKARRQGSGWGFWRMLAVPGLKPALAAGLGTACIVLAFVIGFNRGRQTGVTDPQMAEVQKCYREIEGLFPRQVEAIVFDQAGPHLVLAPQPDVPPSPPLYLKICYGKNCRRFVTFSGQSIRVNGDRFEVLVDRQGEVLLVGAQSVWSSSDATAQTGRYRIEARPLQKTS